MGYIFLGFDQLDNAETLFNRAINLSKSEQSLEDNIFPALPTYNLGVLHAQRGLLNIALSDFQACTDLAQNRSLEDRDVGCLWVPVIIDNDLAFEEQFDIDLLLTAERAEATINNVLASKGK